MQSSPIKNQKNNEGDDSDGEIESPGLKAFKKKNQITMFDLAPLNNFTFEDK